MGGLRSSASPRLAGPVMGSMKLRRYDITVEPNAHKKKPKDAIREAGRPRSNLDSEPGLDGLLDERFLFRRERAKHFQVTGHFPALVSPRLTPSWRLSAAGRRAF